MCDYIIFEDLNLASMARTDDISCDDLTYDYLNPGVFGNVVLGLMI